MYSVQAASGRRARNWLSHDLPDTCTSSPAAEKNRLFQLKLSLLAEKEFLFDARKLIFLGMHEFHILWEGSRETATFLIFFFFNNSTRWEVLGITVNCIWWWGLCCRDLGSMKYPFIAILPDPLVSRVVAPVRVPSMGQIELFKSYLYSIGILDAN